MIKNRYTTFLFILCASLFTSAASAQGLVTGTVNDAANHSTLPGATIMLKGTSFGTITDTYGTYTLTGVAEGNQTLVFSYIGYKTIEKTIEVKKGETIELNISLGAEAILGEELVVTAQMLGQSKAINQQLKSDALVNMVSEDKIKELPDANAAEAIGRVSGVSLIRNQGEGQKVVIRGLEPRFSAITINGIRVPSNDPNDKSVDLSMISPELLQGIEVYKSPTPDMDAEAVGGTVNLLLNKAAEKSQLRVNASGGYTALRNDFGNYAFSATFNKRLFNKRFGIIVQGSTERINRASDNLNYRYDLVQRDNIDSLQYRSIEQIQTDEIRKRAGGSINLDYKLRNGEITLYSLFSTTNRNVHNTINYLSYPDAEGRLNYTHWKGNSDLFSNMLAGKHSFGIVKTDWALSYAKTKNDRETDFDMRLNNTTPFDGTDLEGTHPNIWLDHSQLANDSLTYLYEMSSDQQDISEANATAALNFEVPLQLGNDWAVTFKFGGKYNTLNRIRADRGGWEKWYYFGVNSGKVQSWDPNYPNPYVKDNNRNGVLTMQTFTNPNYQSRSFLNGTTFNVPLDKTKVTDWNAYFAPRFLENRAVAVDNTDITETILAGYAMAKIKFRDVLTVIPGVRMEESDNEYLSKISSLSGFDNSIGNISDTTTYQNYSEILPHLHLKFEPSKWFSLRMSAAKTMARPNYNYISYSAYINENASTITAGNPTLKHMTSMNYDLNMSFYDGKYGLFTIGGFYKDLKNIFYRVENVYLIDEQMAEDAGWPGRKGHYLTTYQNSPDAKVYGFEVDLQTSFKFLPKPFNGVVLSANLTRLFSEATKYSNEFVKTDSVIGFDPQFGPTFYAYNNVTSRKITLPGQVPLIVNLSAGYEIKGFSFRVSGNYQGRYIASLGQNAQGKTDRYRESFWRWDLAAKQKLGQKLELFANVNNLNNMKEISTVGKEKAREGRMVVTGAIFNLGLRLKL